MPSRLGRVAGDEKSRHRERDANLEHRKWYKTARWQKLRMSVLVRDMFTCQMVGCGRIEADTSQLVADHKTPHHGDERLFWDDQNLQCLCKPCHDRLKQKEERSQARR
ncbi:HNH endonuclease [Neorhizobium alkalisoli]|uniref:HNH endonuclease n=1 Tax=Neorhizobium alkalisoli TaxID=528178 RepID=UPI001FEED132|nr:HNH endonuclease signature motif containing protein [Neorhizobium alkalisoli]